MQNAEASIAHVTQTNVWNSAELLSLIQELRAKAEALPINQEAMEQLNDLEEEAKSPSPKSPGSLPQLSMSVPSLRMLE